MAKFKRVADTQGMPEYIEKQFAPQPEQTDDIYAHLRQANVKHKQVIASETLGHKQEDRVKRDWETTPEPAIYQESQRQEESITSPFAGRGIRRAGYMEDDGDNARSTMLTDNIKFASDEELMSIMLRGSTIFDQQDLMEVEKRLWDSQKQKALDRRGAFQREDDIKLAHKEWEEEQMNSLKPKKFANNRSGSVMRTSVEYLAAGPTDLPNYDALDDREARRMAMLDAKREEKLSIERIGMAPEDKRKLWEESASDFSETYQSYKSDWLDKFAQ